MPRRLSRREREEFLAEPRVAVLSVEGEAGRPPLASPCFYHYEPGGELTFFTSTQRRVARKARIIDRTGRVTLTLQRAEPPYRYVTVEGTVAGADRRPAAREVVAIAGRYMPDEHARGLAASELGDPESTFVLYRVRPDRWLTADFADEA
jgi:nitroimidazol reductase NimA-like FMN-containing flavoprotein (pyridoxamine 5'-phosphate oxidase superfamily)